MTSDKTNLKKYNKRAVSKNQIRKLVNMQKAKAERAADKMMDWVESILRVSSWRFVSKRNVSCLRSHVQLVSLIESKSSSTLTSKELVTRFRVGLRRVFIE